MKNPSLKKNFFFLDLINFWISKKQKKSKNLHFYFILEGFFKNPWNLKIPPEWQPCGNLAQNIAYVSAFIDPYPHMKFQVNILSGSKVTEGDGRTDRPPDRQTTHLLEILAGSKNNGSEKKLTPGGKI